jgi:ribosomal protein L14
MFQKGSFSIPSDSSGILLVKVIQTRRCSTRRHADIGKFLRVVLKMMKTKLTKRRKRRVRAIVVRSQKIYFKSWGLYYQFPTNNLVLLKRRMNTIGKELYGPTSKILKIRKFRVAFKHVFDVKFFIDRYWALVNKAKTKFTLNIFYLNRAIHFLMSSSKSPNFFVPSKQLRPKFLKNASYDYFVFLIIIILVLGSLIALIGLLLI